ncbi:FRG domain-containing protein [Flavobacterium sp. LBUM151]
MNEEIKTIEITTLARFIEEIENIYDSRMWFRGHSKISYKLSPTIYRGNLKAEYEINFHTQFKSRALPYLKNKPQDNYWEWLFLMQHHSIPTRLLDWSNSALVALAFAILFQDKFEEDAAIWCLNPRILNDCTRVNLDKFDSIPDISTNINAQSSYKLDAAARPDYPIAITGPLNSERIVAQKGTFTLFPNTSSFNLEDKQEAHNFLTLLILKKENIESIKKQLFYLGITESSIYPDLNNLAIEIKKEFEEIIKEA